MHKVSWVFEKSKREDGEHNDQTIAVFPKYKTDKIETMLENYYCF